jgi:hypothetical protein
MNASQLKGVAVAGVGGKGGGSGGGLLGTGGTSFRSSGTRPGVSIGGVASNGDGGIATFSGAGGGSAVCNLRSSVRTRWVSASTKPPIFFTCPKRPATRTLAKPRRKNSIGVMKRIA